MIGFKKKQKKIPNSNFGKNTPCATDGAAVAGCRRSPPSQPKSKPLYSVW